MGAPSANLNAAKNGKQLRRLTIGELPATMRRQTAAARKYRRVLEAVVVDQHGEIDATRAHLVDEACAAEIHASVCRWLLRERLDKMSASDVLACSREILRAKTTRNRAVERLKLDERPDDDFDFLIPPAPRLDAPESPETSAGEEGSSIPPDSACASQDATGATESDSDANRGTP